jgi:hypothetical protein
LKTTHPISIHPLFKDSTCPSFRFTIHTRISEGLVISTARDIGAEDTGSAVSLLFAAGHRPGAGAIRHASEEHGGFSISLDPSGRSGSAAKTTFGERGVWLELLANGLTFDLMGLSPGPPAVPPPCAHFFGLPADADLAAWEALTLRPGPHLAGGHAMAPVVRTQVWLAALLANLPGVEAVAWQPARSCCEPGYFREGVLRWVEGGVFPGLGLAALATSPDGGMHSEGLALFTTQELRIEPELMVDKVAGAKIGVRLLDWLVESGPIDAPQKIAAPDGTPLCLEPSANGRFVRVWRG